MKAPTLASLIVGSLILLRCESALRHEPIAPAISASSMQASSVNLVTGSVRIDVNGDNRQISFTAVRHQDGSISGQYELNGLGTRIHAQITCFHVGIQHLIPHFNGVTAVGGVVTQASDPTAMGQNMAFIIKGTEDELSPPHFFPGNFDPDVFCAEPTALFDSGDFPLYSIVKGHIEIH